jgi:nitroimidazol reductase NimA-like FMN-containing flavoprotein (pyridoxamine 5'-phosphate oxidase superfamily)
VGHIRELDADAIEAILGNAIVFRLACTHPTQGSPYLVPISCAYDGSALYGHTGPGTKLTCLRANPEVAVETDVARAADDWESVVAGGSFNELAGPDRDAALRLIYPKTDAIPDLGGMTVVFRIVLHDKTGRFERPD